MTMSTLAWSWPSRYSRRSPKMIATRYGAGDYRFSASPNTIAWKVRKLAPSLQAPDGSPAF